MQESSTTWCFATHRHRYRKVLSTYKLNINIHPKSQGNRKKYIQTIRTHQREKSDQPLRKERCSRNGTPMGHFQFLSTSFRTWKDMKDRPQDSSEILSFCDAIGATCYSFSPEEQFHALTDALRQASIEKLGQMLVLHVRYNTEIKSNYSSLNVFVDLISVCVEELEEGKGKFKLSQRLLTAYESSILGKLRAVLKSEYDRLIKAKQCDNSCVSWEEMQFMIDKSFFQTKGPPTSTHDESFFYDQVNRVIQRFYKEFMLVCGSLNGDQLHNSVLEIMPHWVDDRKTAHNIMFMRLFDSMSLSQPIAMDLNYLKQQFISMKVNYNFSRFQIESQCDLSQWQYMYRYIVVRPDRLQHTELYKFLSDESAYERYQYYTTLDIVVYSLIASQTVALLQCNALFIHYAASDFEEDIRDVLRGLFEFFAEVDKISYTIIMTIDRSKKSILPEVQRYAKEYKIKFIVIEEVLKARSDEECFYVRDLTEKARQKLYAKYCKTTLNLFGTTISLSGIVNDDDGLSFVCKFLYNYYELDHIEYIESKEQNFVAIKPRYISRTIVPYVGENAKDSEICIQLSIPMNEGNDIPGNYCDPSIPPLDDNLSPKVCCVLSSSNVRIPLPEYDAKDILHDGYVLEALLAYSVHKGNVPMLRYIHLKTNMTITNRLIAMIMRLLPKGTNVCHKKSMPAFMYLLDQTTDLNSVDDEGRNLLHMTAQNGCFFMMHCLTSKGFDSATVNASNGWNVFNYIVLNEEENRSGKIMEYLLKHCNMIWFDLLDNMLHRNDREMADNYSIQIAGTQDTTNTIQLTKNQYGLLAWMFLLHKQNAAKVLNDLEKQKALECMKLIVESNEKTMFIKEVRNDIPQFTHRIFAEYFAACWMNDNKNRMRNESFFHSWSYWNAQLHQMHDLFNRIVLTKSKENDLHMAVVNQSDYLVDELLTNNPSAALVKDAVGRLPLHLAVTYPSLEIVNLLLDKMSFMSINTTDHLFGWSGLDYAFANRYNNSF
uniref:uncharacterized protein LOC120959671 n=1 Tax=Anopheles coluzzii TaxID=1518534 RepID=UPI0020FFF174|nr:uncharacterized protein LOC120959671 [Anopheles coluzzii]